MRPIQKTCGGCDRDFGWAPEVARKNMPELKKMGLYKDGRVGVRCPRIECRHVNWWRLPRRPSAEPFQGGKL